MIFTEARFLLFFAIVLGVHWALRAPGHRKLWLLLASQAFYAAWDWRFLSLIWISIAVDYTLALAMQGRSIRGRRMLLCTSLAVNLGLLGCFKYLDFFVESAALFSHWLGLPLSHSTLALILPLGISFYTFQTLSYTIDVARGRIEPTRSLLDFALFVSFFPQLVAGPIVRASEFLPQLQQMRTFADVAVRSQLMLFLAGFIKKACVADQAATAVDAVFAQPEAYGAASKWLASALYSLQIYCDFSGYSDMAIATAGLLGYRLALNFDAPYLSSSIREFWRRWHISLSTWFRDYLYIPLGGSRLGSLKTTRNLWLVFLICGLWHGAAWTFVVWGLVHGLFLSLERMVDPSVLPRWLGRIYTLAVVTIAFTIFRSPDLPAASSYITGMFMPSAAPENTLDPAWWGLLIGFAAIHVALHRRLIQPQIERLPDWTFAIGFGAAVALMLPWVAVGYQPFIYFQF
jgi:alginate O-acetyltransferase complex protein AlgI